MSLLRLERALLGKKAIGWALRDYAKTDESFVRQYLATNESTMATLSVREARKHLGE